VKHAYTMALPFALSGGHSPACGGCHKRGHTGIPEFVNIFGTNSSPHGNSKASYRARAMIGVVKCGNGFVISYSCVGCLGVVTAQGAQSAERLYRTGATMSPLFLFAPDRSEQSADKSVQSIAEPDRDRSAAPEIHRTPDRNPYKDEDKVRSSIPILGIAHFVCRVH
jgi:hypothetical protein